MAKPELGTKRTCPDTGRKFYDLNRDPIVSPYTGKTFPLSHFEDPTPSKPARKPAEKAASKEETPETESDEENADTVSLEEADAESKNGSDPAKDDGDDDVKLDDDDDDNDTFLPGGDEEDDDDDDVSDIIGDRSDEEEDH